MSYEAYKVLHLFGIFLVLVPLGGVAMHVVNGGTKETNKARAMAGMFHGLGLVISFVAGFGLIGKLDIGMPMWFLAKLVLWLIFGMYTLFLYRKPAHSKLLLILVPFLATLSAYLAVFKPF